MPVYNESVFTPFYLNHQCIAYTQAVTPYYGTLSGADNYFRTKISNTVRDWTDADLDDRLASLRSATRMIDSLNLIGTPTGELIHFPTDEHGLPNDIMIACYEIALKLLSGIDPDVEVNNLSATLQGYGGGQTRYDRQFVLDHIRAGIPSAYAWSILRPFLCDPQAIQISRGA